MDFKGLFSFLALLCILSLSACSLKFHQLNTQNVITKSDLLKGKALLGVRAENLILPDDDIFSINDKAIALLEHYVPRNYSKSLKTTMLMQAMLGHGAMSLEYKMDNTYTAQQAFDMREANCLAFSYLFVSMARNVGLKVRFQEVFIPPEWSAANENVYYFSRHVNVKVETDSNISYVVDIDYSSVKSHYRVRTLTDKQAKALYYNNVAMEYLEKEQTLDAFRYVVKALKLAPTESAIWSNLGVLYRLNDLPEHAEKAYQFALDYGTFTQSVLNNLATLYEHMGYHEKAQYFSGLARSHQMKNPYYRYHRAQEAYEVGDYQTTLDHLRAAVSKKKNEYKFHHLLALTYQKLGMEIKADQETLKAEKLKFN